MDINDKGSTKKRKARPKKRKFRGNQFTGSIKRPCVDLSENTSSVSVSLSPKPKHGPSNSSAEDVSPRPNIVSASTSKLEQSVNLASASVNNSDSSGFRLFDVHSVISFVHLRTHLGKCSKIR